jgi:hypothetical protein
MSACGGSQARDDDVAALPDTVPTAAPAAAETLEPPTVTPTTVPPPEPTPTVPPTPANLETETATQPEDEVAGEMVISFSVAGGIAGLCDALQIKSNGEYRLTVCDEDVAAGILEQSDVDSVRAWYENLASFEYSFEDNPGGPDSLATGLVFTGQGELEADELQQQVILDWVSSLAVQLRPKPDVEPPTPVPVAVGPDGLCPDVGRPAVLTVNYDNPSILSLIDPDSQAACEIALNQPPVGRIATSSGSIFYPVFDLAAREMTVWQLDPEGKQTPLTFTSIPAAEPGPFDYIVSEDGTKIAWAQTLVELEAESPNYQNNLWVADLDGGNRVSILDQIENSEQRFAVPVRLSPDSRNLYYALQPDIGGPVLSGRYDTLYSVPASGGQAEPIHLCPEDNPVCIGGLSLDGTTFTVVQPVEGTIEVLGIDGSLINTLPLPATDYIERSSFGPGGDIALVTATLSQADEDAPPLPSPGYISLVVAPYTDQPLTLLSDSTIGTLRGWLDESRLAFGTIDPAGNVATSIITIGGQVSDLSSDIAVGVFR